MSDLHVVVMGRLAIGVFQVSGPFDSYAAALAWATEHIKPPTDWTVLAVIAPD